MNDAAIVAAAFNCSCRRHWRQNFSAANGTDRPAASDGGSYNSDGGSYNSDGGNYNNDGGSYNET
jgi:hypothetical protein